MENNVEFIELQQLKTQVEVLNRKLEGQKLLNDSILRRSITTNISKYNMIDDATYLLSIFVVVILAFVYRSLHLPLPSYVAFVLITLFGMPLTYYSRKRANLKMLIDEDIILFGKNLLKMRVFQKNLLYFSFPASMLWVCWFAYDFSIATQTFSFHRTVLGGVIGFGIGTSIWYFTWRKQQRLIKETLNQIEELTSEK